MPSSQLESWRNECLIKLNRAKYEPMEGAFCQSSADGVYLAVCKILCSNEMWEELD